MNRTLILFCGILIFATGVHADTGPVQSNHSPQTEKPLSQSTDDAVAERIRKWLVNDYLKDDLPVLEASDRKFQMKRIDLNNDGKKEIFIRFMTTYFCGSGGCTFYLLDSNGTLITLFSVTRAPIFAERKRVNGWSVLLVRDRGRLKELIYKNGTYPSNPSVVPKSPLNEPGPHAEMLFDESFEKAKTYTF